jgi:hypothetical protein
MSLQQLQNDVSAWAETQFPNATVLGKCNHLKREAQELIGAIERDEVGNDLEEMADILNLLLHAAKLRGYNAAVLIEAGHVKLEECKSRTWPDEPDSDGVFHHLVKTTIPDDKMLEPGDLMDRLPERKFLVRNKSTGCALNFGRNLTGRHVNQTTDLEATPFETEWQAELKAKEFGLTERDFEVQPVSR